MRSGYVLRICLGEEVLAFVLSRLAYAEGIDSYIVFVLTRYEPFFF